MGFSYIFSGSGISPLSLTDYDAMMNTSTSAYLFFGGNSSSHGDTTSVVSLTAQIAINLDNLPVTFVEQGVGITRGSKIWLVGPLATVLLCDAQPKISGGHVRLENDGTVNITSSGQPLDGSFPSTAANLIFSNALQDALVEPDFFEVVDLVNNIAADTFMAVVGDTAQDIAPLDIPSINKNMDDLMSSAAKAFIDGYRKVDSDNAIFDLVSVPGLGEGQQLALTTSKELFIVTVVLDVTTTALLFTLVRSAPTWKGYPFNLTSIFRLLSEGHTKER